jgi:hypothetical protein
LIKRGLGTGFWSRFSNCPTYAITIEVNCATPSGWLTHHVITIEVNCATPSGWLTHHVTAETEDEAVEKARQLSVRDGKVMGNLEAWEGKLPKKFLAGAVIAMML